jgi:hypothetical protein
MRVRRLPAVPAVGDCWLTRAIEFGVTSNGSWICTANPASRTASYAETASSPTTSGTTTRSPPAEPLRARQSVPALMKLQLAERVANEDSRLCRASEATIGTRFALCKGKEAERAAVMPS